MFYIELMDIMFAVPLALLRTVLLASMVALLFAGLPTVSLLLVLASRHVLIVTNVPSAVPSVVLLVCKVRIVKWMAVIALVHKVLWQLVLERVLHQMLVALFGLMVMLSVSDRRGKVRMLLRVCKEGRMVGAVSLPLAPCEV
jgi:hypothetical protein